MLLAGLESQTESGLAETVYGHADDTAGNISLILVAGGYPASCRTTVTHAESESLGCADSHVSAPCGGLLHDCQCEEVAVSGHEHSGLVCGLAECGVVTHLSVCGRILEQGSVALRVESGCEHLLVVSYNYFDAQTFGSGLNY